MTAKKPLPKPDCRTCGLCCVANYGQTRFCNVTSRDIKRLSPAYRKLVVEPSLWDIATARIYPGPDSSADRALATQTEMQKIGPLKGQELTTCVALRGSVGSRVSCKIYPNRPRICHTAVKPGDHVCMRLRKQHLG